MRRRISRLETIIIYRERKVIPRMRRRISRIARRRTKKENYLLIYYSEPGKGITKGIMKKGLVSDIGERESKESGL